ncbi:MAG: MmcQ/YjbR family DNA-binding protein [Actinomycetota bacterium]
MRAETFRKIALSLPEAEERETWGEATFRVRDKIFAMMGSDGKRGSIKASKEEQAAVLASDPDTFFYPDYVGVHGWIGVVVRSADTQEIHELLTEAWRMTAPKRAVKAFDDGAA